MTGSSHPRALDGPINGAAFLAYIKQLLTPTLTGVDIVIADTLPSRKVAGVSEAAPAAGATFMLLPSFSPDQNAVEQWFAKLKALLGKTAPRSREALWRSIGSIVSAYPPGECANYLRNCGYAQSG